MELEVIARVRTAYPTKFGVPRQPGLVDALPATVEFEPDYRSADAVRGLELFDYVWLIWGFSHNERGAEPGRGPVSADGMAGGVIPARRAWSPTVRPPILGGTVRQGVFATRSSFRPNGLALSSVRLVEVEADASYRDGSRGPVLHVRGADMVDGTPVFDVKPYLADTDSHPEARLGWKQGVRWPEIERVVVPPAEMAKVPDELREGLVQMLRQDPRPAYTRHGQEGREFWVPLGSEPGSAVAVYFVVGSVVGAVGSPDGTPDAEGGTFAGPATGDPEPAAGPEPGVVQELRVTRVEVLSDAQLVRLRETGSL